MQESLAESPVAIVSPIVVSLSPRDCARVFLALEFAIADQRVNEIDNIHIEAFEDLELRFKKLLKDGGHLS